MDKNEKSIKSEILNKEIKFAVYGHYGFAMLMFPATTDDYLENETIGFIDTLKPYIEKGKCTVFSVETVNLESWLSTDKNPVEKSKRHYEYNQFVINELLPQIFGICGGPVPVITCGAAMGAYHAANNYFRRPDILYGVIAMSGIYNIQLFSKDFFDDNCYFNSPIHYLPNLADEYWLSFLRNKHHVHLLSGTGENEHPEYLSHISEILNFKAIPHNADFWGKEWGHNPETWNAMLQKIIETKM